MKKSLLISGIIAMALNLSAQNPLASKVNEPAEEPGIQNLSHNRTAGELDDILTSIQNLSSNLNGDDKENIQNAQVSIQNLSSGMKGETAAIQNLSNNRTADGEDMRSQIQNLSANRIEEPGDADNIQNLSANRIEEPGDADNIQNLSANRIEEPNDADNIQNLSNDEVINEIDNIIAELEKIEDNESVKDIIGKLTKIAEEYKGSSYKALRKSISNSAITD